MKKIVPLATFLFLVCGSLLGATPPWRFLVIADWHSAEGYVQREKDPGSYKAKRAGDIARVSAIQKRFGGDLIVLPGDSNVGHWDRPEFIEQFEKGLTPEEAILKAGRFCYEGMAQAFREGGYSRLLMAVGDHEMGDNPWPVNSDKSRCQPQFREAFSRAFNYTPDGATFLYEGNIGEASTRPIGTPYQDTSYAYRHKNALFLTIDAFHQEDPGTALGDMGSVTGTVSGPHLEWLERVLSEARKDPTLKHIIVQAHLPVIYPVRKVSSSGIMMDGFTESAFWMTLRKYKVDVYLAGEVHSNTATRDPESDLVQLVTRGNGFSNLLVADVSDQRIEFKLATRTAKSRTEDSREFSGRLIIDKSGDRTRFIDEGELQFLDPDARQVHFNFEEESNEEERPIPGLSLKNAGDNPWSVRGVQCAKTLPNRGQFGRQYDAVQSGIEFVQGPKGLAGRFNAESRMAIFGMGPHYRDRVVSYAVWVRSDTARNHVLINSGRIWGSQTTNFMNLHLNNGAPVVMFSGRQQLLGKTKKINDGEWHHIAVSPPGNGCRLSEVRLFVDGKQIGTSLAGEDARLELHYAVRLSFGGLGYTSKSFDKLPIEPFVGEMDDISVWTRPLSSDEVAELAK